MTRIIRKRGLSKHIGEGVIVISRGVNFCASYCEVDGEPRVVTRNKGQPGESHYALRDKDKIWIDDRLYEFRK